MSCMFVYPRRTQVCTHISLESDTYSMRGMYGLIRLSSHKFVTPFFRQHTTEPYILEKLEVKWKVLSLLSICFNRSIGSGDNAETRPMQVILHAQDHIGEIRTSPGHIRGSGHIRGQFLTCTKSHHERECQNKFSGDFIKCPGPSIYVPAAWCISIIQYPS